MKFRENTQLEGTLKSRRYDGMDKVAVPALVPVLVQALVPG